MTTEQGDHVMLQAKSSLSLLASYWRNSARFICCYGGGKALGEMPDTENKLMMGFSRKSSKHKQTLLTGQQRIIILRTWYRMSSDISSIGLSSMTAFIALKQEAKRLFDFFHLYDQEMHRHPQFRQHGFWLVQAIYVVIENLDNLDDSVEDLFVEIGQKHSAIPAFDMEYFAVLPAVWSTVWEENLKDRFSRQTKVAWQSVFQYIVVRVLEGYRLGLELMPMASTTTLGSYFTPSQSNTEIASLDSSFTSDIVSSSSPDSISSAHEKRRMPSKGKISKSRNLAGLLRKIIPSSEAVLRTRSKKGLQQNEQSTSSTKGSPASSNTKRTAAKK